MTTPPVSFAVHTHPRRAEESTAPESLLARAMIGHALLVGLAADLLLFVGPSTGFGFTCWVAIVTLTMVSIVWQCRREVGGEATAWLIAAVLAASGIAWRESGMLQFLDGVATVGALGMAAVALSDVRAGLFAARLRDTIWRSAEVVRSIIIGILPLALRELFSESGRGQWALRGRPVVRAALIALVLLFVFGSLLRGADPIFASLVALPDLDIGSMFRHLVVLGLFTWLAGGWFRGAVTPRANAHRAPDTLPFALGMLDVTTALGTLNVLFAAFVATQLGWFFGGEHFLQARTGLTAATYAREGFFQMLLVVMLVVPVLLATRAALAPGRALARRHTMLALPVIGLLGAIIVSAMLRLKLYVHYYGLTTDRLYPLVLMGWLAVLLAWLAWTVLRGNGRLFVAGALISAFATLVALNLMAPDAIVARVNIARHEGGADLDLAHLAKLSGEATALATGALLTSSAHAATLAAQFDLDRDRCSAARSLLKQWGPASAAAARQDAGAAAWRTWNAGEAHAVAVVAEHAKELRTIGGAACYRYHLGERAGH